MPLKNARSFLSATAVTFGLLAAAHPAAVLAQAKDDQIRAVYHFTNGLDEASRGLGNIRNHLAADLKSKGVDFRVCNNTLVTRKIDKSKVIQEASIVPSGVAEAAKLQAREGYVYLRP
jgi:uncharacterized protein